MNKRIVVIGAGAAGVAATTALIGAGFRNIALLEAEHRIGGRVHTIPFGENVVDMGAQWCHGEKDNVVFELANSKNLLSSNTFPYENFPLYRSNGVKIPEQISSKLVALAYQIMHQAELDEHPCELSLGNYAMEKYNEALKQPEYSDVDPLLARQFIEFFHKFENSIEASDNWYDTSAKSFCQYWICEGDHLLNWKDKGYRTVLDLLQRKLSSNERPLLIDDRLRLNKEVRTIVYNQSGATAPARIECTDGSIFEADHVICTVSLGVLKERHARLFQPLLPLEKINAIEGLTLGTVDKIYVEFDKPFWPKDWQGCSLLWNYEELKFVREHKNSWLEDVFGFYTVDYQPNILCGWVCGPSARQMEQTSHDEVVAGVMWLLRTFLSNFIVQDPVRVLTTKWYSNPHFRGSYTYYSLRSDAMKATTTQLSQPVLNHRGEPTLLFAGEATHAHYYSTVHGAVESGWREAKRLADFYKLKAQL